MATTCRKAGPSPQSARVSNLAFFGYGSLVNRATHAYHAPRPARLDGWRRVWRGTHLRKVAYLSVTPDETCSLQGLVADVHGEDWAALDAREAAYRRHDVTDTVSHSGPIVKTALYQVEPHHIADNDGHPILLSYLDVVVQGYLLEFGEEGVADFFQTTSGWHAPILDDRANPIYPRHQNLSADQTALVDRHLAAVMEKAE